MLLVPEIYGYGGVLPTWIGQKILDFFAFMGFGLVLGLVSSMVFVMNTNKQ